ncbi:MAG: hypothetical protein WC905_03435 [Patescibacteria group bacterium]
MTYELDYTSASATYFYYPNSAVSWGTSSTSPSTNVILVTAFNDTAILFISADNLSNELASISFLPYHLDHFTISSTQLSASLSTFYVQASTNEYLVIPGDTKILWNFAPGQNGVYANFEGESYIYDLSAVTSISEDAPNACQVNFGCDSHFTDIEFYATTQLYKNKYIISPLSAEFNIFEPQSRVILNPGTRINIVTEQPTYISLSAIQLGADATPLIWDINDDTKTLAYTGISLDSLYTFGDAGTSLSKIKISATDLSYSYIYSLSSYSNMVTGTFRPYGSLLDLSLLSARVIELPDELTVYKYSVHALGITENIPHILSPFQYILWNCDNTNITTAKFINNDIPYVFGTVGVATNIDNLYLQIAPPIVSTTPKICSINFQICAISGSLIEHGIMQVHDFNILFNERLSDTYFNPKFRFQYEPEIQNTIYRPITSSAVYSISNTSILPPDSFGYMEFTFNDGVCSVPFDIRNDNPAPSGVTHEFSSFTEQICTISMTVYVSTANFANYSVKNATKRIVFAHIPPASGFVVYPQYEWDGTDWSNVVSDNGNILTPTSPLSAFGLCHTENFYVSSNADIATTTRWNWNIQDINNPSLSKSIESDAATAWVPTKTGISSTYLSVCASVFTDILSTDMPSRYYDTPEGIRFNNISTTFDLMTSDHKQHIKIIGIQDLGIRAGLSSIKYSEIPVPNNLYLSGYYTQINDSTPFNMNIEMFSFNLSSEFWYETERANSLFNNMATVNTYINVDDIANSYMSVPANEKTKIEIIPGLQYTFSLKKSHPIINDWCLNNNTHINESHTEVITAYPMLPVIYTPNRFVLTGTDVVYENLIQCFTAVSSLVWQDRDNSIIMNSCAPYITTYTESGNHNINLLNRYQFGEILTTKGNLFDNIVTVQNEYIQRDSNITRIYGVTRIELPYDAYDCLMPSNELVVADTFNSSIIKLQNNLTYLDNMSHLYDVPPTSYIGWYGTLYYNNSAKRTRWYTNTPYNSYGYEYPENSIDSIYNDNLQSCCVKNNIMYISNGSMVNILSGDLWATLISTRSYKTLDDDFINIRAIKLDDNDRIYLLDSYDSNNLSKGSKNRVLVFAFNMITSQWQLMYEWGGLGGPGAKNKFNHPSDLHIDNNVIWVADTNNKCVKKYTRTGSWLATIISPYFNDNEKPVSVTTDTNGNTYILTNSQVLKYDSNDLFVDVYGITAGAIKIRECKDGGFIYIVYSDRIVKFTSFGSVAGTIAQYRFSSYIKDYRDVYHDEYRNFYIVGRNHILKYVDLLTMVSLKANTTDMMWPIEKMTVQKDEFIQDWVINRCFQRLWDNIEIFRRSLIGKFDYYTYQNITRMTTVSTLSPPADFDYCNYDWLYDRGKAIETDIIYEYEKPVVRSFTTDEYKILPYEKQAIYIGINELHAADVYNRLISKLHACEEIILQMIND